MCWVEFQALSEAKSDEDEKENRRFGRLMALMFNMNRSTGQPTKSEEDFIPKRKQNDRAESKEELTEQINSVFKMFM